MRRSLKDAVRAKMAGFEERQRQRSTARQKRNKEERQWRAEYNRDYRALGRLLDVGGSGNNQTDVRRTKP